MKDNRRQTCYTITVSAPPHKVFPLLCPVREHEWIPYWNAEMICSRSGVAEEGAIFRTRLNGQPEMIWTVSRYEPNQRIGFVAVAAGLLVMKLEIALAQNMRGQTQMLWRRDYTAISEEGKLAMERIAAENLEAKMAHIERLLEHFCRTGNMLPA